MLKKIGTHAGICSELTALYERKNHDYGDSFGKNFAEYGNVYPIIHLSEKLDRLKTLVKGNDQKVTNESIEDTLLDLANYAIMTLVERKIAENEKRSCTNCKYGDLSITEEPCSTCDNKNNKWEAETNASD